MSTDLARQDEPRGLAVADPEAAAGALAHILATGDLANLSNEQRVAFYKEKCRSLGLNSLSTPFDWLTFQGKLVLYPNKSCAEQLRRQHQISVRVTRREIVGELFVCEVRGTTPTGRTDEASKYVPLKDGRGNKLVGADLANAFAKAETSAKRRLVLSMIGLSSPPDPEELRGARFVTVDGTGRVIENPTQEQRYLAENPHAARAIGAPTFESTDAGPSPVEATASQAARPEELVIPKREGPRPSFRASEDDIRRWCGAWFAIVDETPWDSKEARALFVADWTAIVAEWPKNKQTDSLRTLFARCTNDEAAIFLGRTRATVDGWRLSHQYDDESETVAELTDEEIDERFEQSTERVLGRKPAERTGPTKTELIVELRKVVAEVKEAGGTAEVAPDDRDLLELDEDVIASMIGSLRTGLEGLRSGAL